MTTTKNRTLLAPPTLQPAPILNDVTNSSIYGEQPSNGAEKSNDLSETEIDQVEEENTESA